MNAQTTVQQQLNVSCLKETHFTAELRLSGTSSGRNAMDLLEYQDKSAAPLWHLSVRFSLHLIAQTFMIPCLTSAWFLSLIKSVLWILDPFIPADHTHRDRPIKSERPSPTPTHNSHQMPNAAHFTSKYYRALERLLKRAALQNLYHMCIYSKSPHLKRSERSYGAHCFNTIVYEALYCTVGHLCRGFRTIDRWASRSRIVNFMACLFSASH